MLLARGEVPRPVQEYRSVEIQAADASSEARMQQYLDENFQARSVEGPPRLDELRLPPCTLEQLFCVRAANCRELLWVTTENLDPPLSHFDF